MFLHVFAIAGPTGIAPIQNALVTALAHSVGANLVHLNLAAVERVRDLAAATHAVDPLLLSKAAVVSALLEACEDAYSETTRPAVVVFDDHPAWLLSNEAAAEVRIVFIVLYVFCMCVFVSLLFVHK